eukprot:GHVT01096996.1.p2 GENE.GHVT01096996.1~~GHVT01096996.1.p2  ORF type:complete len:154 (+),score=22.29 GHVT01096996.1:291-752(+)
MTVAGAIEEGWGNMAINTILRDSSCRFARQVAGDQVAERCPGLTAVAVTSQASVVSITAEPMEVTPSAAPAPVTPVTKVSAEASDMAGTESGQFDPSSPDQSGSEPAGADPEGTDPASESIPAQASEELDTGHGRPADPGPDGWRRGGAAAGI